MAPRKSSRKTSSRTSKAASATRRVDDLVTLPYGTVVYYFVIGLIIGLSIGALLLLWVSQAQAQQRVSNAVLQSQLLQTNPYVR